MPKNDDYEDDDENDDDDEDNDDDEPDFEENLVFVIMPFQGQEFDETYSAIKGACTSIGLKAKRVNENVGSHIVIDEISELIDDAEFIVCDLSAERPNVYYELGYAHGTGNEPERMLLIAKEGTTLHFDIAPLRVEFYKSTEQLRSIISSKLKAMRKITRSAEWLDG